MIAEYHDVILCPPVKFCLAIWPGSREDYPPTIQSRVKVNFVIDYTTGFMRIV